MSSNFSDQDSPQFLANLLPLGLQKEWGQSSNTETVKRTLRYAGLEDISIEELAITTPNNNYVGIVTTGFAERSGINVRFASYISKHAIWLLSAKPDEFESIGGNALMAALASYNVYPLKNNYDHAESAATLAKMIFNRSTKTSFEELKEVLDQISLSNEEIGKSINNLKLLKH